MRVVSHPASIQAGPLAAHCRKLAPDCPLRAYSSVTAGNTGSKDLRIMVA